MTLLLWVCYLETEILKDASILWREQTTLPPLTLVIAYAIAGTVLIDFEKEPLGNVLLLNNVTQRLLLIFLHAEN